MGAPNPRRDCDHARCRITRSAMRAELRTSRGGKAAARRKESAAASSLSPTALAEARAGAAEDELLAMLELAEGVTGSSAWPANRRFGSAKVSRHSGTIECSEQVAAGAHLNELVSHA